MKNELRQHIIRENKASKILHEHEYEMYWQRDANKIIIFRTNDNGIVGYFKDCQEAVKELLNVVVKQKH